MPIACQRLDGWGEYWADFLCSVRLFCRFFKKLYFNCGTLPRAWLFWLCAVRKSGSWICQASHIEWTCTYTATNTHTRRIFMRLINLCLCADGNHRKKEIYSEGLRRSRSPLGLIIYINKGWRQLDKCHILYAGHHWHLRLLIVLLNLLHSLRVCAEHYWGFFLPQACFTLHLKLS